jgi:hypothetical protein
VLKNLGFVIRNLGFVVRNLGFVVRNLGFVVRNLGFVVRNLGFVVPRIFNHSNKTSKLNATIHRQTYYFDVQTLLDMFWALFSPSSGARQTAVSACGFHMNVEVEVFLAVVSRLRTLPPPHSYGNHRLQQQFDGLLMMGIIMPETC